VTALAWELVAAAVVVALLDWVAVAGSRARLEYVAKPLALLLLLAASLVAGGANPDLRPWLVLALAASLVGDVFLLPAGSFPAGLLAFLVAQLAYLGAFVQRPWAPPLVVLGIVAAVVLVATVGRRIVRGAPRPLRPPVAVYLVAICLMAIGATGTGAPIAIAGAWLFVASDTVLGWDRFAGPAVTTPRGAAIRRLAVIAPYHAGQLLLLVALAS
jgi:uncharacterized membrane protein YhhN